MRIGVIGSGRIGSTLGRLWAEAGHEVMFASRRPERLDALVAAIGGGASRGRPEEAARFGEAVLVSVPLGALPELGREIGPLIAGKVVIETGNPYPERDGAVAREAIEGGGTGRFARECLPGARVVRAFTVWDRTLAGQAHRPDPKVGIPLAGDDEEAVGTAAALVRDAGFEPVVVGPLDDARRFDVGTPVYNTGMTAADIRAALGL